MIVYQQENKPSQVFSTSY